MELDSYESSLDSLLPEEHRRVNRLTDRLAEKADEFLSELIAIALGERPKATGTQLRAIIGALNAVGMEISTWNGPS